MTFRLCKKIAALVCAAVLLIIGTVAVSAQILLGDANGDDKVAVTDATEIQRSLAKLPVSDNFCAEAADVNGNGKLDITDATQIQRWLAKLNTPYPVAQPIEEPTEEPTEGPTEEPTEENTQLPTDEEGWSHEVFRP